MPLNTITERKNVQLAIQPNIGLDASARQAVVGIINILLADEAVLSFKNGYTGEIGSLDRLPIYDVVGKQIQAITNELMERVQILGGLNLNGSDALNQSARLEKSVVIPGMMGALADQEGFIRCLRDDAQTCSDLYEDQGTFALLVSILRRHEKMAWMLRSYIENEPVRGESQKRILKDE